MRSRLSLILVVVLALSATVWASTPLNVTSIGTGKQIWLAAGGFDSATPQFANDSLAGTLSGQSYSFTSESPSGDQQQWYSEYTISAAAVPGVSLTGSWYFWARTTQAGEGLDRYADSDWLFVKNDPADGTGSSWASSALSTAGEADKVFNNSGPYTGYAYGTWGWMTTSINSGGQNVLSPVVKQFNAEDNTITFRIYEREAGAANAHLDVICWTNDAAYTPTDGDFASVLTYHDGDGNKDGMVTDADYTIWADHYGLNPGTATWEQGDYNKDLSVSDADYTIWADNYGFGVTGDVVPEPATLSLLGLGLFNLIRRR